MASLAGDDFFVEPSAESPPPDPLGMGSTDVLPPDRVVAGWLTQDIEPMRRWLVQQGVTFLRRVAPWRLDLAIANAQVMRTTAYGTLFSGCEGVYCALHTVVRVLLEIPGDVPLTLNSTLCCEHVA